MHYGGGPWYRCINCEMGMDVSLRECKHCGHKHTNSELKILKKELRKKQYHGVILGIKYFPLIFGLLYLAFHYYGP